MQIDKPTPNPSTPAVNTGLGQSMLSLRIQVHPRVTLDLTDTYFRDVPTYDPSLVGTGLLDKYLYQGINGGAAFSSLATSPVISASAAAATPVIQRVRSINSSAQPCPTSGRPA
jgi:hypothetical protein